MPHRRHRSGAFDIGEHWIAVEPLAPSSQKVNGSGLLSGASMPSCSTRLLADERSACPLSGSAVLMCVRSGALLRTGPNKRVTLISPPSRTRMTGCCAKRTTGIDAKHRTRPRPWMSQLGPEGEHFCTLFLRPVAIDSLKADSRCMRVLEWRVRAIHKRRWACRGSHSEFRTCHVARSLRKGACGTSPEVPAEVDALRLHPFVARRQ
jgi:hypothetical protein